ncbi:MAG TPA: hypothetical protein VF597_03185 [Candidatus Saccharimonadales bacterium]|jgi:hypothetical protein
MDPSLLGRPMPAPTAQRQNGGGRKRLILLIIGGLIALIAGGFMLSRSGDQSAELQKTLSARQATTLALITDGQKNIQNGTLSKLNSDISIILNGDNVALQAALADAGLKKIDKEITAAEADTATFEELTDARLNATYDGVYRRIITTKLESLSALLRETNSATKSRSLKAAIKQEYEHIAGFLIELNKLTL